MKSRNKTLFWVLFLIITTADQLTKWAAESYLRHGIVFNKWFSLRVSHNTGCAWGLLPNQSLTLAWIGFGALILAVLFRKKLNWYASPWISSCLLGGILGNVLDRFIRGYVVDFVVINLQIYRWPAFNLADAAMCIALVCWLFSRR
ncbi:MAG: signal peptidase II [Verrucomicrobiota bacterium]|nr:MAG: signal peptidase II [Verrucomicrobiota bacterium]